MFGFNTSGISSKNFKNALAEVKGEKENSQITCKLHNIDWVFNDSSDTKYENGLDHLITALAEAPHEDVFGTDFIVSITEHVWQNYYR